MTIRLRPATAADLHALLALWHSSTQASVSDDIDALHRLLARDPEALLLAVDSSGNVVGSVIAAFDGWRGTIYRLAVDPSWRRKGLASRLLAAAEDRFQSLGARRSHAIVIRTEAQAIAFWRSTSWVEQKHRARFVRDGT